MAEIVFLSSYPRSGNTWMRVFLENLLHTKDQSLDINRLQLPLVNASSRNLFDDILGLRAAELPIDEVRRLRPEVLRIHAQEEEGLIYAKIHDALYPDDEKKPVIPIAVTRYVIYIIRNPLDVVVSLARFFALDMAEAIERLNDDTYTLSNPKGGIGVQLPQKLKNWSNHVQSWTSTKEINCRVIRYEDMLTNPMETFSAAIDSIRDDIGCTEKMIEKAIMASSFEQLKILENEQGFTERSPVAKRFFHTGKMGSWKQKLSRKQVHHIIGKHETTMKAFGYI